MRLTLTLRMITLAVLAVASHSVQAQLSGETILPVTAIEVDSDADESDERLATIESRLSMIESNATHAASSSCRNCPIPSSRISTRLGGCATNYAGFELAVLKAHVGSLGGSIAPLGVSGSLTSTFDYDVAPRIYFGHERACGVGARLTYFEFDHNSDPSALGIVTGLELHALDLELTNRVRFCGSDFLLSAGYRYGKLEQNLRVQNLGSLGFESEGGGMTIGAQMNRALGNTQWNLTMGGRASLLLTDNEVAIPGLISVVAEESTMRILELRLGLNRTHELECGARLVGEIGLETQNWDSAAIAGLIGNDASLFGPTFRLGLNY